MKKGINFSLQLLKNNRKYHAGEIKRIEDNLKKHTSLNSYLKKGLDKHKKYHSDLTLAINTLLEAKTKEESNNIVFIHKYYTSSLKKQATNRILCRQNPKYKIIKKLK